MHEHVQLCQDPQTEFALLREILGVSRIDHILRVHGHTIPHEEEAATIFDEVGQRSLGGLGTEEHRMLPALHTRGPSFQPNRGFST